MLGLIISLCAWGILSLLIIVIVCVLLYCLYLTAGFWIALGVFLFIVFICRSKEKKIKAPTDHDIEYGAHLSHRNSEGFHFNDFALGWIISRLFK